MDILKDHFPYFTFAGDINSAAILAFEPNANHALGHNGKGHIIQVYRIPRELVEDGIMLDEIATLLECKSLTKYFKETNALS